MKKTDILYGREHDEQLSFSSLDEFVEDLLCEYESLEDVHWPIRVFEFRRVDVSRFAKIIAEKILEDTIELLDEEHGDPNGDQTEPTQAMKDAADKFAEVVVRDYVPWSCEPTGRVYEVTKEKAMSMLKSNCLETPCG